MSASGQRPCWRSHGRGHHLPGRSTSIRALWRTAWVHESACWAVAVERWARRGATRRRKGLFQPFVRYLTHLDLEPAGLYQIELHHNYGSVTEQVVAYIGGSATGGAGYIILTYITD